MQMQAHQPQAPIKIEIDQSENLTEKTEVEVEGMKEGNASSVRNDSVDQELDAVVDELEMQGEEEGDEQNGEEGSIVGGSEAGDM